MASLKKDALDNPLPLRISLLVLLDILVINCSAFLALFIRHEFSMDALLASHYPDVLFRWCIPLTLLTLGMFVLFRLYSSLWGFAGADELAHIFSAVMLSAVFQQLLILLGLVNLPRSFPVLNGMLLFMLTTIVRFSYRFARRVRIHFFPENQRRRTMLIGAGQAGALVLREFKNSRLSQNHVVCIIDDDPGKKGREIMGVPIVGGREYIEAAVKKYDIAEIIFAIPSLSTKAKKEIWDLCSFTGCKLKQLPGIYQLANGEVSIQTIRDIEIEDLLERDAVHIDMGGLSHLIQDKTVMVTGGGGSIGSELCRQLASFNPKELIIFDIYENNAYAIELELLRAGQEPYP